MFNRSTKTERYTTPHTIGGETREIELTRDVSRPPRDVDALVLRGRTVAALVVTLLSLAWSAWSIGAVLGGSLFGYGAAVTYDTFWLGFLASEWNNRREPEKRKLAKRTGWAMLALAMAGIAWHGVFELHSIGAAILGATVSLGAKLLWQDVLRSVNIEMSERDVAWVRATRSAAHAELMVAQTLRQVARLRASATALTGPTDRPAVTTGDRPTATNQTDRPAAVVEPTDQATDRPSLTSAERTPAVLPVPAHEVAPVAPEYRDDATGRATAAAGGLVATDRPAFGFVATATDQPAATDQTDRPTATGGHCPGCDRPQATDRPCSERCRSRVRRMRARDEAR